MESRFYLHLDLDVQKLASSICIFPSLSSAFLLLLHSQEDSPMRNKMGTLNLVIPKLGLVGLAWVKANLWLNHCGQRCPFGQNWAMRPSLQTKMKLQLSKSQRFPKRILGHCSHQPGGNEDCAGKIQSVHCRPHDTVPTLNSQSDRKGNLHNGFFPSRGK